MRRPFGSVRARATLAATVVVAVVLIAAGAAVLLSLRTTLESRADSEADGVARQIASRIAAGTAYADLDLPDAEDNPVQVVGEDGRVLAVSEGLEAISGTGVSGVVPAGGPAAGRDAEDAEEAADGESDFDGGDAGELGDITWHGSGTATVDGERTAQRFAAAEVTDARDQEVRVYAGASLAAQQEAVRIASTVMLIGLPVLLAVVGSVTWLVTRRALRPVEGIRREMAEITASEDLSRRVPEPGTHDEIARLARTTNETLAALETSVERQRRFVADASHELRSPIASLRTQLEVAAAHPELLDLDGAVEDTVRLQRLAADLLLLARLDAGERPAGTPVDLVALAREEAAGRTRVTVVADTAEGGPHVAGSRGQLGRVLANLLDNAERHARSAVTVTVRRAGERSAVLEVADDGHGVPETDRERIFERFVRLDDARGRDEGGAGLGLAIARDVAVRHGGTLTVRAAPAGGALFELRLPVV
ncbi:sensor histidine kinase [Streptomyces sp. NPDC001595]|uniref:sensor histidine kinase n=1 Tax=Streptomyces sp. NPDC001532 TaxID=3154520 RepID=UPI00332A2E2D